MKNIIPAFIILLFASCTSFQEQAKPAFKTLEALNTISYKKCSVTRDVWSTAIFDKKYALSTSQNFDEYYVSDFNIAISRMESEPLIKSYNTQIDSLTSIAKEQIKAITKKGDLSYDKLISLYTNVVELGKKALEPQGNLQSFSNDINNMESEITRLITEIKARNPDFDI